MRIHFLLREVCSCYLPEPLFVSNGAIYKEIWSLTLPSKNIVKGEKSKKSGIFPQENTLLEVMS